MSARTTARGLALIATSAALLAGAPASADDAGSSDPMRVAVWLRADGDEAIFERVRGQVVDLDVTLIPVRDREPRPGRGREAARAIGRDHDAAVVVWFRAGPRDLSIYVADLDGERLLVRGVGRDDDGELARSAALETAAVIVRSSLRAIAAGGAIGIREAEPPPPPPSPRPPPPPPPPPPREAEPHPQPRAAVRPFAAVGWSGAFTDGDSRGHHGLAAAIGLTRGRVRLAVEGGFGRPVDYADEMTAIRVSRSAVTARAEVDLWRGARVEVGAAVAAGAAAFSRSTVDPGELTATAPDRVWSPLVAPDLRVRVRVGELPVGVEVAAGADVLLRTPTFGYEIAGEFVAGTRLWPVVPRVGVAVVVEGGR